LRDGRNVGTVAAAESSSRELARMMVGRDVVFTTDVEAAHRPSVDLDHIVLAVDGLCADGDRGQAALHDVSFALHAGEVVAVCGVAGNGQRELAEAICATRPRTSGSVVVDGQPTKGDDPRELIEAGVAHVPEDRLHTGLAASASIEDNLVLKSYRKPPIARGPFVRRSAVRANATALIERFEVRAPSPATSTRLLSGGNLQKVLLARELSAEPTVVIAASPTRGLDVGAIETVRGLLLDVARAGAGVLLITEELEEAIALASRILVIYEGRIVGEVPVDGAADGHELVTHLGLLMGGGG
jgi:simple sugar transport system ATP-binding protein